MLRPLAEIIEIKDELSRYQLSIYVLVSWVYITIKIITLLEFFSFVSEVSRLQYEWSSDCWCIWKLFGINACLQWRKYFHFIGELFLYSFFAKFALVWSISSLHAGIVYEHYCLCPGWRCARRSLFRSTFTLQNSRCRHYQHRLESILPPCEFLLNYILSPRYPNSSLFEQL
jgi:hypothetical protein